MAKPSSHLDWAVGNADPATNIIEPSSAKKISAWTSDERPPYEFFNWLFYTQHLWNEYFEAQTDAYVGLFDVVVNDTGTDASATHDDLQAAVNDGALGTNLRVLVKENATINTKISLTKAGWRVYFAPGVVFTKGTANVGLSLENDNIEILNGRFVGFTGGSDKAIELTVNADYCKIVGARFAASTNIEVDDSAVGAGKKPVVAQTITEV